MRYARLAGVMKAATEVAGMPTIWWWRERFWLWAEGAYDCLTFSQMVKKVHENLMRSGSDSSHWAATDTTHALAALSLLMIDRMPCWITPQGRARAGPYSMALEDCLVDPVGLALHKEPSSERPVVSPHDPAWFSTVQFPFSYDPDHKAAATLAMYAENLTGPDAVRQLRAFAGYCLLDQTNLELALFLIGPRGSGKSLVADTMRGMFGPKNCSALTIDQFGKEYAMPLTEGKLLNIADETSNKISEIAETRLKSFISGKPMEINQKHTDMWTLDPTARLLVCMNDYPEFHDASGAIWRRIAILRVPNVVPDDKKDSELWKKDGAGKLNGDAPGLFNFALRGLGDYLTGGQIPICLDSKAEWDTASTENCKIRTFLVECFRASADGYVPSRVLYSTYQEWCDSHGYTDRVSTVVLGRAVRREFPSTRSQTRRLQGVTLNGHCGIERV